MRYIAPKEVKGKIAKAAKRKVSFGGRKVDFTLLGNESGQLLGCRGIDIPRGLTIWRCCEPVRLYSP